MGDPGQTFILYNLDLWLFLSSCVDAAFGRVCAAAAGDSNGLCVSVHRDAGEVVPDDLINCGNKRERGDLY